MNTKGIHLDFSDKEKAAVTDYLQNHHCPKSQGSQGAIGVSRLGFILM